MESPPVRRPEGRRREVIPQRLYLDEEPEDPYQNERFAPEPVEPDPLPRRSMPVSRRAMPPQREPMDVEPMDVEPMDRETMESERPSRRSRPTAGNDDLDDPW